MKSLKREVKDFFQYFGVKRKDRLDTYLENIVASQTGFKARDIEIQVASKVNMEEINEFDSFEFIYHKQLYKLVRGELTKV